MPVTKEIKETISATVEEVFTKMNRIAWIDRQKTMTDAAFKNTEKLLYSFRALQEHIKNEVEYFEMLNKKKSKSVIRYSKEIIKVNSDQILQDRADSYSRSKSDCEKIQKAIDQVKHRKGYEVIEMRYFLRKDVKSDEVYTYEDIAEQLAGKKGYSENLNEKTVRMQKNKIVKEIAILLFGSDAI